MVDLDGRHNDPARLSGSVDRALSRVDRGKPFVLVIDDLHVLHRRAPHDALVALANDLPEAATLAMASRATPPLPLARLRSERMITELGPGELAMTRREAAALFKAAGHDLDHDAIDTAMRRTEGWPASLALAVLFLADRSPASVLDRFSGEDRLVAQYLREEVLSDLASEDVEFMRQTSLADTLTAPLCDSLLHRPGSAAVIERLASAGLWCRSTGPMIATATAGRSARCCTPSCARTSPHSPRRSIGARAPGMTRPATWIGRSATRSSQET